MCQIVRRGLGAFLGGGGGRASGCSFRDDRRGVRRIARAAKSQLRAITPQSPVVNRQPTTNEGRLRGFCGLLHNTFGFLSCFGCSCGGGGGLIVCCRVTDLLLFFFFIRARPSGAHGVTGFGGIRTRLGTTRLSLHCNGTHGPVACHSPWLLSVLPVPLAGWHCLLVLWSGVRMSQVWSTVLMSPGPHPQHYTSLMQGPHGTTTKSESLGATQTLKAGRCVCVCVCVCVAECVLSVCCCVLVSDPGLCCSLRCRI